MVNQVPLDQDEMNLEQKPKMNYSFFVLLNIQHTGQAIVGCLRSSIYCVNGDGSNSYLSNGNLSVTIVHGVVWNLIKAWADRGGRESIAADGQ